VQLLDVAGPLDVFAEANVQSGRDVYRLCVLATSPGPVQSSSGVTLLPDAVCSDVTSGIDTLLIAGAPNASSTQPDIAVLEWLRKTAQRTKRYGSVCSGAFLIAAAGLADGRRVSSKQTRILEP
jgi:transcriptional regulator GlxA family with amidase domain